MDSGKMERPSFKHLCLGLILCASAAAALATSSGKRQPQPQTVSQLDLEADHIPMPESTQELIDDGILNYREDMDLPTSAIVAKRGYPVETHTVTTEDGYILTLHRIPSSQFPSADDSERVPILVQHGLVCSSADWVLGDPSQYFGYMLADAGYDVWLGNFRGNTYSKRHVNLTVNDKEFWEYSYHEHGIYDVTSEIDYILHVTGKKNLFYAGHSMGNTAIFIALSEKPEYNEKVRAIFSMAPIAYVGHMVSPLKYIAPFAKEARGLLEYLGVKEFMPSNIVMTLLGKYVCHGAGKSTLLCSNVLFLICGYNSKQLNMNLLPVILGHTPAGTSTKNLVHFAQGINSGKFQQYDYGHEENMARYGQSTPPDYDVSKISVPVGLFWSDNDWLAVGKDVADLAGKLPNLIGKFRIADSSFNHLDYLWAIDANKLVYARILNLMKRL